MAGRAWMATKTVALISAWREEKVREMVTGSKCNRVVYSMIGEKMSESGWKRTWEQCRTKLKNLVSRCRKVCLEIFCSVVHAWWKCFYVCEITFKGERHQ